MKKSKNNVDTLKKVSADTKNINLALPLSPAITMGEIKKARHIGDYNQSPSELFALLIETKEVCTTAHLNEMFHLSDKERRCVFYEGRGSYGRGYFTTEQAYKILESEFRWDSEGRPIPLVLTPAQQKLRAILVKCIKYDRYEEIAEEFEENFGTDILYEVAFDMQDEYTVTEEEVLDALNTYQAEHQA